MQLFTAHKMDLFQTGDRNAFTCKYMTKNFLIQHFHKNLRYRKLYQLVRKAVGGVFFQRLKDLREDRDLRQEDVAEILGISQTVYSRYERGFQTIPVTHLLKLADYYKVSTDYILGRTNNSKPYNTK